MLIRERVCFGREFRLTRPLILTALVLLANVAGCGRYPEINPAAFELAKAIANVCNARNGEQLETARQTISAKREAGEITDQEERILSGIVERAAAGEWEHAERQARQLLKDQTDW